MKSKLLMDESAGSAAKIVRGANMNANLLEGLKGIEGLNLKAAAKVLTKAGVLDMYVGYTANSKTGKDIPNIFIEFNDQIVAVPLSSKLEEEDIKEDIVSKRWACQFYIQNRRLKDINGMPLEGEDEAPSGALYICFGKGAGLEVTKTTTFDSMVEAQPGVKA